MTELDLGGMNFYFADDRWFILSLLAVNYFTLFLHRNLIQYVQPQLVGELDLTNTQLGWLDAGFRIAYALARQCCQTGATG